MRIKLLSIFAVCTLFSCVEAIDECATCYEKMQDISTSEIQSENIGSFCGTELDSIESIQPVYVGNDYKYYYECE